MPRLTILPDRAEILPDHAEIVQIALRSRQIADGRGAPYVCMPPVAVRFTCFAFIGDSVLLLLMLSVSLTLSYTPDRHVPQIFIE